MIKLSTVRTDLAAILSAALPNDVSIIDFLPDSVSPPVVFVAWSDPWIAPSTYCVYEARMEVLAVAQRIDPGGKLELLEDMLTAIIPALKGTGFMVRDATSMYPLNIGGVDYLAATVNLTYDVE